MSDDTPSTPFKYHLELTPAQLKVTHAALHSLLDDFGHDESDVREVIREVLSRLPDDHAIRAIQLDAELERELESRGTGASGEGYSESGPTPGAHLQAVPDEDEEPRGEGTEPDGPDGDDDEGGGPSAA